MLVYVYDRKEAGMSKYYLRMRSFKSERFDCSVDLLVYLRVTSKPVAWLMKSISIAGFRSNIYPFLVVHVKYHYRIGGEFSTFRTAGGGGVLGESDRGDYAESAARGIFGSSERLLRRSRILVGKSSPNSSDPARQ
ncbi:hypothetical protein EMIT07CA2_210046 [Brevibacillus sp. IT-7CA2]